MAIRPPNVTPAGDRADEPSRDVVRTAGAHTAGGHTRGSRADRAEPAAPPTGAAPTDLGVTRGDPVCWLSRVCEDCGALVDGVGATPCWNCGAVVHLDR